MEAKRYEHMKYELLLSKQTEDSLKQNSKPNTSKSSDNIREWTIAAERNASVSETFSTHTLHHRLLVCDVKMAFMMAFISPSSWAYQLSLSLIFSFSYAQKTVQRKFQYFFRWWHGIEVASLV